MIIDEVGVLRQFSSSLGSQAMVVNVNYVWQGERPYVYDYRNNSILKFDFPMHIKKIVEHGAGEIIITSVHKDGSLNGFDDRMVEYLDQLNLSVPIIISGGGGNPDHYLHVLSQNLSAATGGSVFSLTEHTPQTLRQVCNIQGLPMRRG
jgi:cyclase